MVGERLCRRSVQLEQCMTLRSLLASSADWSHVKRVTVYAKPFVACCAILLLASISATAQMTLVLPYSDNHAGPVIRVPYQADKWTRVQRFLPDGSVTVLEFQGEEARDPAGRIYEESQLSMNGTSDARNSAAFCAVYDPANYTLLSWSSKSKIAIQEQLPNPTEIQARRMEKQDEEGQPMRSPTLSNATHTEDLGHKSLNGFLVDGKRTVTVIPAGAMGNSQPITATRDIWTAEDLHVVIMEVRDDPRTGKRTMELRRLRRITPDPALYQLPEGYIVHVRKVGRRTKPDSNMGRPQ